jgi:hypothetical protein
MKNCRDEIFLEQVGSLLRTWGTIYKAMKTGFKLLLQITLLVGRAVQIICDITIVKCQYLRKNYLKSFTGSAQSVKNLSNLIRWLCLNLANLLCRMWSTKNPTLETKILLNCKTKMVFGV